jgi:hypothetical protein
MQQFVVAAGIDKGVGKDREPRCVEVATTMSVVRQVEGSMTVREGLPRMSRSRLHCLTSNPL